MHSFFHRIRKELIGSGATRKYFLYATGEVLLVMVGILLALQVNNWNEGRKENNQIKIYLRGLIEALEDDIKYLNYTIQGNKQIWARFVVHLSIPANLACIPILHKGV